MEPDNTQPPANEVMIAPEDVASPEMDFATVWDEINQEREERGVSLIEETLDNPVPADLQQYEPLKEALITGDPSAFQELEIQAMGEDIQPDVQQQEGVTPATDLQPEVASSPVEVNAPSLSSNLLNDTINTTVGLVQAALWGLGSGAEEATRTVLNVSERLPVTSIAFGLMDAVVESVFGVEVASVRKAQQQQFKDELVNLAEVLGIPEPDTMLDEIVATIVPTIIGGLTGIRAVQGLKLSSALNGSMLGGWLGKTIGPGAVRAGTGVAEAAMTLLGEGVGVAAATPADLENFADMLDQVQQADTGPVGRAARVWLKSVPGVESLVKSEGDSFATQKLKNALDVAYGGVVAPVAFLALRNRKMLVETTKAIHGGKLSAEQARPILQEIADDGRLVDAVHQQLEETLTSQEALDIISKPGNAPLDNLAAEVGQSTESAGVTSSASVEPELDMGTEVLQARISESSDASGESFIDFARRQATQLLGFDKKQLLERIQEAKQISEAAELDWLGNLKETTKRYEQLSRDTKAAAVKGAFDGENFANDLQAAFDSGNSDLVTSTIRQWADYMEVDGPMPALLSPAQVSKWTDSTMDVTNTLLGNVKRLTTTNPKRVEAAAKALTHLMGHGSDAEMIKMTRDLLRGTAQSTAQVDRSAQLMLMNGMYVSEHLLPTLDEISDIVRRTGSEDALGIQQAVMSNVAAFEEANKNLKSAMGRGLQAAQIDPAAAQALKQAYGAREYDRLFNAGGQDIPISWDEPPVIPDTKLTEMEKIRLQHYANMYGYVHPDKKLKVASRLFKAGTHPVWKHLGSGAKFGVQLASDLAMSSMLFHPSTWGRVFTSAGLMMSADAVGEALGATMLQGLRTPIKSLFTRDAGTLIEREGKLYQMVFKGAPIGEDAYNALTFKATVRALAVPHAMKTMGESFVRPGMQEIFNFGSSLVGSKNILGPERFAAAFGKDTATKVFTSGGGATGFLLKAAGHGLGFPQHVMGAFETGINSNALLANVSETLYQRATQQGLKGVDRLKWVEQHAADAMADALVAKHVSRGRVPLKNQAGVDLETLRGVIKRASDDADLTSLRARELKATTGLETAQYADRVLPRMLKVLESGMQLPVAGPLVRTFMLPFGSVVLNMLDRALLPAQTALAVGSRAAGIPGLGGKYMDEVISGLHGPARQAQALGWTFLAGGTATAGALNMAYELNRGRSFSFPLGPAAQAEAGRERDARFDDVIGMGGGAINAAGLEPLSTFWKAGSYAMWIDDKYSDIPEGVRGESLTNEFQEHILQLSAEAAPATNLIKGMAEVFGSFGAESTEGGATKALAGGLGSGFGSMLKRPLSLGNLMPGEQTPGKNLTIKDQGFTRAFMTALGGGSGEPNRNRITAYAITGEPVRDKYDPVSGPDQFLEAFGFASQREYDTNPYSRFLGELENHGITLPALQRKMPLKVFASGSESVDLQNWYSEKTKENLWDVYNRFVRDRRVISPVYKQGNDEITVKEALNQLAEIHLPEELNLKQNSYMYRLDNDRKRLSVGAAKMLGFLQTIRNGDPNDENDRGIKGDLEIFIQQHADEFTNDSGQTLREFIDEVDQSQYAVQPFMLEGGQ